MFPDISPASEDVSKVLPEGKEIINDEYYYEEKLHVCQWLENKFKDFFNGIKKKINLFY